MSDPRERELTARVRKLLSELMDVQVDVAGDKASEICRKCGDIITVFPSAKPMLDAPGLEGLERAKEMFFEHLQKRHPEAWKRFDEACRTAARELFLRPKEYPERGGP